MIANFGSFNNQFEADLQILDAIDVSTLDYTEVLGFLRENQMPNATLAMQKLIYKHLKTPLQDNSPKLEESYKATVFEMFDNLRKSKAAVSMELMEYKTIGSKCVSGIAFYVKNGVDLTKISN